ncbi:PITH domain-containing protein CG6153 [Ixodes scapularis]|uniref:PITH domain-containing protein CG6153 n=1 Tax=Ixodes scapularis TaxID=6945 RepID=UPI001A9FC76B|nr:PITH domain-containing protein CG6153 [Ixodes scapularis]XP_040071445.1 PITH domain-containing protein CG6153 [Ixodes scapularis]
MPHDHGDHGHDSCGHGHQHSQGPDLGIQYSLYSKIDLDNVQCLNEEVEGSGKLVFKPWELRLELDKFVDSDADEELLFNIPFTGNIKLKSILVMGGESGSHPSKIRMFKNRPRMTFDDARAEPEQEFELHPDNTGTLEYPVKIVKFSSVQHLSLHFPSNFGADSTRIYYVGLKGEFSEARRQEIPICSYELAPNPADHKVKDFEALSKTVH